MTQKPLWVLTMMSSTRPLSQCDVIHRHLSPASVPSLGLHQDLKHHRHHLHHPHYIVFITGVSLTLSTDRVVKVTCVRLQPCPPVRLQRAGPYLQQPISTSVSAAFSRHLKSADLLPFIATLLLNEQLQNAHMMPRQPMREGEAQVAMAPGGGHLEGQPSSSDAPLSRLQLRDGQIVLT